MASSARIIRFFALVLAAMLLGGCIIDGQGLQVGAQVPVLRTKTLHDVGGDFSRITSYRHPDARMYQLSLDEALGMGKPIVLEFATPGHCTVCDKQLQMLKGVMDKYGEEILVLHMDQYQNPEAFKAFGVIGDPWTYVIDGTRTVQYKQAGRMLYQELDMVLRGVIRDMEVG